MSDENQTGAAVTSSIARMEATLRASIDAMFRGIDARLMCIEQDRSTLVQVFEEVKRAIDASESHALNAKRQAERIVELNREIDSLRAELREATRLRQP